jgi:hypothetical protein
VDVQHVTLAKTRTQPGQEIDAALANGGFLDRGREQASVPEDALCDTGSAVRVKQDAVVEESEQHNFHPHRQVEALDCVGAVARGVPKVVNGGHVLSRRCEYCLKGFKIAMNIAQDRSHGCSPLAEGNAHPRRPLVRR